MLSPDHLLSFQLSNLLGIRAIWPGYAGHIRLASSRRFVASIHPIYSPFSRNTVLYTGRVPFDFLRARSIFNAKPDAQKLTNEYLSLASCSNSHWIEQVGN